MRKRDRDTPARPWLGEEEEPPRESLADRLRKLMPKRGRRERAGPPPGRPGQRPTPPRRQPPVPPPREPARPGSRPSERPQPAQSQREPPWWPPPGPTEKRRQSLRERLPDVRRPGRGDGGDGAPRRPARTGRMPPLAPRLVGGIVLVVLVLAGAWFFLLRESDDDTERVPEAGVQRTAERRTSFLARMIPPPPEARPKGPQVPRSVSDLVRRLPTERKVAQLFLFGFQGTDLTAPIFQQFRRIDIGGLVIDAGNYLDPQQLTSLAGEAVLISQQERHVPPWVIAPQEGGDFNVFPDLPPRHTAADLATPAQAAAEAREAASTLKPLGIRGLLAPVIDVGLAEGPAVGARAFSDDPDKVAAYARAVVTAYRSKRVFAAAGHFPGLGSGSQSTEDGPANVGQSLEDLRARDLVPFRAAIRARVPGILLSHGLYALDDFVTPASLSSKVATGLLRRELKFRGVAITDDLADPPVTALESVPDAAVKAVQAGADMVFISGPAGDQQAAYVAVLRAARRGEISRRRLNQAVRRILTAKRNYGLIR